MKNEDPKLLSAVGQNNTIELSKNQELIKPYWTTIGWYTIAAFAGVTLFYIMLYLTWNPGSDNVFKWTFYLVTVPVTITKWLFIGWETNTIKSSIIGCGITVVLLVVVHNTGLSDLLNSVTFAPWLFGTIVFSFLTLPNTTKRIKFIVSSIVISIGVNAFHSAPFLGLEESFNTLLHFFHFESLPIDFGTVSLDPNDPYVVFNYSAIWIGGVGEIIHFLALTFAYKYIKSDRKLFLNTLQLGKKIKAGKMALYVFVLYSGIAFLSFGIIELVKRYIQYQTGVITYTKGVVFGFDLHELLIFLFALIVLYFLVWFYRKITLEYYLDNAKPISWNYFFSCSPIIGFFIWVYNLLTFKSNEEISKTKLADLTKPNNSIGILIISIMVISLLFSIIASRGNIWYILFGIAYFIQILLFIKYSFGLYLLISIHLGWYLLVVGFQIAGANIPEDIFSYSYIFSLCQIYLMQPVFHFKIFKVEKGIKNSTKTSSSLNIEKNEF